MEKLQLKIVKGDGGDVLFDERVGGPCLRIWFKSSNFLAARQIRELFFKKILNWTLMTSNDL